MVILKGHGRLLAALEAEFDSFPVVIRKGLSETDKVAMRMADNQVALLAGWDRELVRDQVQRLRLDGYQINLLGFSEVALRNWEAPPAEPDSAPAPSKTPVSRAGDVWVLGGHRLICGDSTKPATWDALFGKADKASVVFTDPPYGVSYESPSGAFEVIQGDDKRRDELYQMLVMSLRQLVKRAMPAAAFYIWHASSTREDFAEAMKAVGLAERQYLMWVKPSVAFGRADYQWQHEPCFYASKADKAPAFYGERAESTVWHAQLATARDVAVTVGNGVLLLDGAGATLFVQAKAPKNKKLRQIRLAKGGRAFLAGSEIPGTVWQVGRDAQYEHPTQKPVELARRAIENSSRPGEIVADAFLGSGTTLIGAEMTGRRCFGAELDPAYCDVIVQRWEKFAGKAGIHEGAGATFAQTVKARAKGGTPRKIAPARPAGRNGKGRPRPARPSPSSTPGS